MDCQLSIITPVYNGEKWIKNCIESVISQKCPQAEHVIIDGGSTDATCQIIKEFAAKYPHISWSDIKQRGQVLAMNSGIKMARGKIIGFLNVDDFYEADVFNRILGLIRTLKEPALLVGNLYIWDDKTKKKRLFRPGKLSLDAMLLGPRINMHPVNPSSYFYHKTLHDMIGLYDPQFDYNHDLDFIIRAVKVANVKYVDEIWGNYYIHEQCKTFYSTKTGLMKKVDDKVVRWNISKLPLKTRYYYLLRYWVANNKIYQKLPVGKASLRKILSHLKIIK
ncbi:MAG: glycosyltransferase [Candidatus Omnitrophica bacterium]|nr:glycosyltransferase [Candidatus Omnitrophota bacterium]